MRSHLVLIGGVVLALAACTAPPAPSPSTVPVPTSAGPPQIDKASGAFIAREGIDYETLFDLPSAREGESGDHLQAVLPDGSALVMRGITSYPLSPMQAVVRGKDSERVIPTLLPGPNRQAPAAAASPEQTVAWMETASTSLEVADWELFGIDQHGTPRHLASSTDFADEPIPPTLEYDPVAVDATHAFITTALPYFTYEGHHNYYSAIVSAPLNGAKPTIAVHDAYLPAASTQGLYYARTADVARLAKSHKVKDGTTEFWLAPRDGGPHRLIHTQTVADDQQVRSLCIAGDRLVWATATAQKDAGTITILSPGGTTQHLQLAQSAWEPSLTCTPDLIAWGGTTSGDTGQYLYSLTTGDTWKFGNNGTSNIVMVSGKTIAWSTPPAGPSQPVGYRVARWLH